MFYNFVDHLKEKYVIKLNDRIVSSAGSLLFGLFIMFVYIFKHAVPLTDIYLGSDRTTHVKVVFIAGILGVVFLLLFNMLKKMRWMRYAGYGFSFFLMVILPALIFLNQSRSFRGIEWALETLIIGIVPLLFVYAAFLIFFGNRIVNLFLALFFVFFSIYHLLLLLKVFRSTGRAFSATGSSDIWFMLTLIISSSFFAFFSFKRYLSSGKSSLNE